MNYIDSLWFQYYITISGFGSCIQLKYQAMDVDTKEKIIIGVGAGCGSAFVVAMIVFVALVCRQKDKERKERHVIF